MTEMQRRGQGKITVTGANIILFAFSVVFIFYQLAVTILFGEKIFTDNIYLTLLVNELVLILAPVLIYTAAKRVNVREVFRFHKPGALPVLLIAFISVPAYFFAAMLNNLVCYLLQTIGKIPSEPLPVPKNLAELLAGLLFVAVLPGFCEEMLHRGLLLRAYEKRGSYKAVAITALFFGIFHMDVTNLLGPVFLGLLIGYYVIRTNSIFAGMFAHFLNNALAELFQYFSGEKTTPRYITISNSEMLSLLFYGITGLIAVALLLFAFKKATEGRYLAVPPISSVRKDIASILSHWPVIILLVLYLLVLILYLVTIVALRFMG